MEIGSYLTDIEQKEVDTFLYGVYIIFVIYSVINTQLIRVPVRPWLGFTLKV